MHLSRSGVVERILKEWCEEGLRDQLSREAAEHYQSLTVIEQDEDTAIAKFGTRTAPRARAEGQ